MLKRRRPPTKHTPAMSSRRFRQPTSAAASVLSAGSSTSAPTAAAVSGGATHSLFVPAGGASEAVFGLSAVPHAEGSGAPSASVFSPASHLPSSPPPHDAAQPDSFFGNSYRMSQHAAAPFAHSPPADPFSSAMPSAASSHLHPVFNAPGGFHSSPPPLFFSSPPQSADIFSSAAQPHVLNTSNESFPVHPPPSDLYSVAPQTHQPPLHQQASAAPSFQQPPSFPATDSAVRLENFIHEATFPTAAPPQKFPPSPEDLSRAPNFPSAFPSDSESTSLSSVSNAFALGCQKCGRKNDPDANFCAKCGCVLAISVPESAAAAPPTVLNKKLVPTAAPAAAPLVAASAAAKKDVYAFRKRCSSCFLFGGKLAATSFNFNLRQTKISLAKLKPASLCAVDELKIVFSSKKSPKDIKSYLTKLLASNRVVCSDLNLIVELILGLIEKDVSFSKFTSVLESIVAVDNSVSCRSAIISPAVSAEAFNATNAAKNLVLSESAESFVNELMSQNQFALALTVASTLSPPDSFRYCLQYFLDNHTSGPLKYVVYSIAGIPFDDGVFRCWKEVALFFLRHPSIPRKELHSLKDALSKRDPIAYYIFSILFGLWDGSLINLASCWHNLYFLSVDNWILSEIYDDISTYPPVFGVHYKIWLCKHMLDFGMIDELNRYLEKNHSLFSAYPDPFLFRLLSSGILKIKSSAGWFKIPKLPSFMDVVEKVIGGEEGVSAASKTPVLASGVIETSPFTKSVIPEPPYTTDSSATSLIDDIQQGVLNLSISSQKFATPNDSFVSKQPLSGPGVPAKSTVSPELYHSPARFGLVPEPATPSADVPPPPQPSLLSEKDSTVLAANNINATSLEDEYGFGNSKLNTSVPSDVQKPSPPAVPSPASSIKSDQSAASAQSSTKSNYFGFIKGIFKKQPESTGTTPVVANLDDEDSFVYDDGLKRWVNKKSGSDVSVADAFSGGPPKQIAPAEAAPAAALADGGAAASEDPGQIVPPQPPMASFGAAPPLFPAAAPPAASTSSTSGAPYKNVKSRYVDILAQESGSSK